MQEKLESSSDTNIWTLVERPNNNNVISEKCVNKYKTKADGSVEKYKACYVAKGFKQSEGIDCFEISALARKPETLRPFLSLAAKENYTLRRMDVKSAYLHLETKADLYLEQPMGFEKLDNSGKIFVCRLNKLIYGSKLKTSPLKQVRIMTKFLD